MWTKARFKRTLDTEDWCHSSVVGIMGETRVHLWMVLFLVKWQSVAGSAVYNHSAYKLENRGPMNSGGGKLEGRARRWMSVDSVQVELAWKAQDTAGYSVNLGVEQARWTVLGDHPYYTVPSLAPGQEYTAVVAAVGSGTAHHFQFTTPNLVSGENLRDLMKEMKRKKCPDNVRIAQVSLYLELEPQEENVVLEALDISSSRPLQWVDIPANSSHVFLSGLPPDKLLNVTLKLARGTDPLSLEHYLSKTVFTGGCVPPTSSNFTRTLLDFFFPTKSSGHSKKWNVRCYADDEVFFGFPCHNSDICVPMNWMCDKEDDCPDGDDEDECGLSSYYNAGGYCRKNEFRCLKRREHVCLPISWLCDGHSDCSDGWDEDPRNCRGYFGHSGGVNYHGTSCRHSYFKCRNDVGCVAPKFVCDGEDDCADGSDEWNCGSDRPTTCDSYKEFQCFRSYGKKRCIPRTWVCDDQEDCDRGEDEDYDLCRRV